jgi:predicted TIM-barrel fold metal-dependent hydrolase
MAPIIDVHVHLFNAIDIPLEGYLRSRRSEKKPLLDTEYIVNFFPGPHVFHYLADRIRERCITRELKVAKKGFFYRLLLWSFEKYMRQEMRVWEDSLSKAIEVNASDLTSTWKNVDLFVPLMIDFEYWFKNTIDNSIKDRIDAMVEKVILPYKGKFHPFVPFDPARELAYRKKMNDPDGQLEKSSSLELVKRAIEEQGFIGVKLYNALGYKPLHNDDEKTLLRRNRIAIRNQKMQYVFKGKEYDEVLLELYDYCLKNEVPITTHCMMHGIESYPDASFHFGSAKFWRVVLDQFKGLRLNLAHFGWNPVPGHRYGSGRNWMQEICSMMRDYEYLFADVAHHEVTSRFRRNQIIGDYKKLQSEYMDGLDKIKKRILYGSDWHVLRRLRNYPTFLNNYIQVMNKSKLYSENEIEAFLGGNAFNFLGLLPGGKNRIRLEKFYKRNHIDPPEWFRFKEA